MTLVTPPSGPDFDVTDYEALAYYRREPGYVVHDGTSGPLSPAPVVPTWAASTSYSAGQVVQHPSLPDLFLRRIAQGVSRGSFDATELALWKVSGSATYQPVFVAPVVGDGATDDAATINARLTDAHSAGGGRVIIPAGASGVVIVGATIVIPASCALDINHGVILRRKAGFSGNLIQNSAVQAGGRDANVGLTLGVASMIDGGDNSGGVGTALHHIRFRHVDGLTISGDPTSTIKTTTGAKYSVSIADVTNYQVGGFTLNTFSDGIHIAGPATSGRVHDLYGASGDDMVAITPRDWAAYDDSSGAVADLTIENIYPTATSACAVKVLGGDATTSAKHVRVRNVYGSAVSNGLAAVVVGDDPGSVNTTGGLVDDVTVENVSTVVTTNSKPVVVINGTNTKRLRVKGVHFDNTASTVAPIRVNPTSAGTFAAITLADIVVPGVGTGQPVIDVGSNATITSLVVDRVNVASATQVLGVLNLAGIATDLTMRAVYANVTGSSNVITLASGTATAAITRTSLVDVHLIGTGGSVIAATNGSHTLPNVEMANVTTSGNSWLADLATTTELHLSAVTSKSPASGIANIRATAVVTVTGDGVNLAAGGSKWNVAAGGKVAVRLWDAVPGTTAGSLPTLAAGAGLGGTPTVAIVGSDRAGTLTLTPGTTPAAGVQVTATFMGTWPQAPKVALTPTNAAAQAAGAYVSAKTTTTFVVSTANAPGGAMTFDYVIAA